MADWLALHGMDAAAMRALLDRLSPPDPPLRPRPVRGDPRARHDLTPQAGWTLCAAALRVGLGAPLADAVTRVETRTRVALGRLPAGGPRAATLPDGGDGHPLVTCPWEGQARDLLTMAHEMGHAVQLTACAGRFMPPVPREACAFVAEAALLAHLAQGAHPLAAAVAAARAREAARIAGAPLRALRAALDIPQAPYAYAWNYPPARALADRLADTPAGAAASQPLVDGLFRGRFGLAHPGLSARR